MCRYAYSLLAIISLTMFGCAHTAPEINPSKFVSPSAMEPAKMKADELAATPLPRPETRLNLSQLVEAALDNNPSTRRSWALAKARAAEWAVSRGNYYPNVEVDLTGAGGKIPLSMGGKSYFDTSLSLNYLLLDFGSRAAEAEAAKQALIAANWNFNQVMQDVLRDVPQAYYILIGNKALVVADEKSLKEATISRESAEQRFKAGVATLADVLEAKSNEEQMKLNLAGARGSLAISHGALATAVGWPANTQFDVVDEDENLPIKKMGEDIDALIEKARKDRPELNAAIASVRQKEAELKKARALPFPKLTGNGDFSWMTNRNRDSLSAYYGGMGLQIPIFDGFKMRNSFRAAKANLDAAKAALDSELDNVVQEVWSAHYNFQTATEQLSAAKALLASAEQSFEVSLGRYKAGAANIVELMNVQSQLASARAQLIGARMNLYTSFAELVHSVGAEFSAISPGEDTKPIAVDIVQEKDVKDENK